MISKKEHKTNGLDSNTRKILLSYLHDILSLPNESAKTHRFVALASELFPGSGVSTELSSGIEKRVRIYTSSGKKRGRIDAYYGNAIIEFENSLKATEHDAIRQLREYTSAILSKDKSSINRPLICIASDGIIWKSFRPSIRSGFSNKRLTSNDIELEPLRTIVVSEDTLKDFWVWLTSLLFRPGFIKPSAEQFRVDFGLTSPAYSYALEALKTAWSYIKTEKEASLAFETWQKYLTVTYGQLGDSARKDELELLFLKHTYLSCLARLLIWASLSRGRVKQSLSNVAKDVLSGSFFQSQGIENLVEDDFFQWVRRKELQSILSPIWERVLSQMLTYSLDELDQDILKGIYQELVDPKDRHDLGEYYTPDWLCELITHELFPDKGFFSVLDPTCGSGSFLRAAIVHLIKANSSEKPSYLLRNILTNVAGIDIHPLAVIISRATYLLAIKDLIKFTRRPIQIPVFLADSLFLPSEVSQPKLGETAGYQIRFGRDKSVNIPDELVTNPEFFDPAITAATKVAADHARTRKESKDSLLAYIKRTVPSLSELDNFSSIIDALWNFTNELADLIIKRQNSIWAFIIRNAYRPAMLRERFDFIVGNPPWLSYRYISDPEYQAEVKRRAVEEYKVAPKSWKLATQMELASVFFVHTISTFGHNGSHIGFVMPRSVINADQHINLISGAFNAPVDIESYWDLLDVKPLFNIPSCVLFGRRDNESSKHVPSELPAIEWHARFEERDLTLSEASKYLSYERKTARIIYLAERMAFSTGPGRTSPHPASSYSKSFRQGATIVPRNFYFVRIKDLDDTIDPERLYWAETDRSQAESAKPPYKDVFLKGYVDGRFIFLSALSKHVLPFVLKDLPTVVLPIYVNDGEITVVTSDRLLADGYREFASWMIQAERIWNKSRKEKSSRQSLYERLNYQNELTAQNLKQRHLVVYNASGTNISAVAINRASLPLPYIVESTLYWISCLNSSEAHYLTAILNSSEPNRLIKPFQSMGLMGERHIHKKVLDLPIPRYNSRNEIHRALSALGARAQKQAYGFIRNTPLPSSLARQRAIIRENLEEILSDIDDIVHDLLS
jgi:hypothetical protein